MQSRACFNCDGCGFFVSFQKEGHAKDWCDLPLQAYCWAIVSRLKVESLCVEAYTFSDAVIRGFKLEVGPGPFTDAGQRLWRRRAHFSVPTFPKQLIQTIVLSMALCFLSGCDLGH